MKPIYLPENFNGSEHMKHWASKVPFNPEIKADFLEYFVHMIVRKHAITDKYEEEHKGFVPLYSPDLKRVSKHYRSHLEYLKATGVMDINDSYSTATGRTKAYRLKQKYKLAKPIAKQLTNSQLKRIHQRLSTREAERMREARAQYPFLVRWLDEIKIDRTSALEYVDGIEDFCKLLYGTSEWKGLRTRFNVMRIRIELIAHQDISYLVDNSGHRFHSNLTSLNKELRHFLTYRGKPLGGVDIKNSQPYLSQLLLSQEFWKERLIDNRTPSRKHVDRQQMKKGEESPEKLYQIAEGKLGYNDVLQCTDGEEVISPSSSSSSEHLDTVPTSTTITKHRLTTINMFLSETQMHDKQDVANFLKHIQKGLYEFLMESIFGLLETDSKLRDLYEQIEKPIIDRSFVKELTMVALYSHPNSRVEYSMFARRIFKICFPTVHKVFAKIKRDDYTLLPILLQRIEAKLVLDRICKEFWNKYRQPVYTIHDGIITTVEYLPKLKVIAESVLKKAIGASPTLVEEIWSSDLLVGKDMMVLERMLKKKAKRKGSACVNLELRETAKIRA